MSAPDLDQDALATLTPEEREAIEGSTVNADDLDAIQKIAGSADDSDEDEDEDDDSDDDADDDGEDQDDAPADDAAPAPAPDVAGQAADDVGDDDGPTLYNAQLPADYEQRWSSLQAKQAEIQQKFNDGDLDLEQRDAELATLQGEREKMLLERARVESLQEADRLSAQAHWQGQIKSLFKQAAGEGIDYAKDDAKAADLDLFVKQLASRPENADKNGNWFLQEAHKRVKALHGIATAAGQSNARQAIADAKNKRRPPIGDVPENLAGVPGGDGPGDVGDEFADIMALEGQAYEDAIARMSQAQREKFLKG